jgi:uncharacterized membrane protein YdfJ with MMPL/SSD domain
MFTRLADLTSRRPRIIVVAAVLLFVVSAGLGGTVADRLGPYGADDPDTESVAGDERLEAGGVAPGVGAVLLLERDSSVRSAEGRAEVRRLARELASVPGVARVDSLLERGGRDLVSRDGRSTYLAATFSSREDENDIAERVQDRFEGRDGVVLGGPGIAELQVNEQVGEDLARAELLAFPILFLLSLWFFRSLVAALLPPLVGALTIVTTFLGLRIASEFGEISVFALNLVTALGLGLAIDYSLFIVSRFREELAKGFSREEAIRVTLATAGRTVLFSSLTVAAALAALLVFPQLFLYSMGIGGVIAALIACTVSLVVLPAVLYLLGPRVNALSPKFLRRRADRDARPAESGGWYRLSRFVMRRPGRVALASAALLIVLGVPFWGINFTSVDASVLPESRSARQVDDILKSDFPPNRTSPILLAVDAPAGPRVNALARELREVPGVAAVRPARPVTSDSSVVEVISRTPELADETQTLVRDIRDRRAPFDVAVTGRTADFVDLKASLVDHAPLAVAIIVVATFLVMFLMTGSVVLPLKAVVMNVLTLSATFGILVFIFQDGRLEGLLDYTSQGALETTQPLVLLAVAFGLSTDYAVFLLARIKEARDAGASDSESVAIGLERTGRIVTAAALLFSVAIAAFATSSIIFIKEVGLGTALAVLIDASIVRALLVPSLMELLGKWNWWAPRPLRRLHERIGLSEGPAEPATAAGQAS